MAAELVVHPIQAPVPNGLRIVFRKKVSKTDCVTGLYLREQNFNQMVYAGFTDDELLQNQNGHFLCFDHETGQQYHLDLVRRVNNHGTTTRIFERDFLGFAHFKELSAGDYFGFYMNEGGQFIIRKEPI